MEEDTTPSQVECLLILRDTVNRGNASKRQKQQYSATLMKALPF